MQDEPITLSVVLPCYNPPDNWEDVVANTVDILENKLGIPFELLVVNDGSTRNCEAERFNKLKKEHPNTQVLTHEVNMGKGRALRTGVQKASGSLIIYTDIDFPYNDESFTALFVELKAGSDVVLGHRDLEYYRHTPFLRRLISKTLRFCLKSLLKLPTDDSQCGIKGFNRSGKAVFLGTTIDRFLFDLEFIKLVSMHGLTVRNVDVQLKPNVIFSKVNIRILLRESRNFLKILFRRK
ncbi:MAG: glycosyltransferase family 2 protein [Bacteroidota bacterium]|jgi:glycosyltransferase involved in cell wall biosynthesis